MSPAREAALRERIADLEEIVRQQRSAFAPRLAFPAAWKLKGRDAAILASLYVARGGYVGAEAVILWVDGADSLSIDVEARQWIGIVRSKLEPHGITIETVLGKGWSLTPAGHAVIAAAIGDVLPAAEPAFPVPASIRHPRGWEEAENAVVRAGYAAKATLARIAIDLQAAGHRARSLGAISTQAQKLGLTNVRSAPLWSKDEDAIVRAGYEAGLDFTAIKGRLAEAGFRRNRGAIGMRVIALGISGDRVKAWGATEIAIVRAGLKDRLPYPDIQERLKAAGYPRGRTAVYRLARSLGARRRQEPEWTPEQEAVLRRRYAAKVSQKAIADELGRTTSSIASMASKLGLKQRERWKTAERERLVRGFEAGEPLVRLSEEIGRPVVNVAAEARRMGLSFAPSARRQQPSAA